MRGPIPATFGLLCAALLLLVSGPGCDAKPETLGGPVAVVEGKPPTHGMLGVEFAQDPPGSLEVSAVLPTSPADEAGLARGDRITSINGRAVTSVPELQAHLKKMSPGATAHIAITRHNEAKSVEVRLISFGEVIALRQRSNGGRSSP